MAYMCETLLTYVSVSNTEVFTYRYADDYVYITLPGIYLDSTKSYTSNSSVSMNLYGYTGDKRTATLSLSSIKTSNYGITIVYTLGTGSTISDAAGVAHYNGNVSIRAN